jgi:hypothetical protein
MPTEHTEHTETRAWEPVPAAITRLRKLDPALNGEATAADPAAETFRVFRVFRGQLA